MAKTIRRRVIGSMNMNDSVSGAKNIAKYVLADFNMGAVGDECCDCNADSNKIDFNLGLTADKYDALVKGLNKLKADGIIESFEFKVYQRVATGKAMDGDDLTMSGETGFVAADGDDSD